MARHRRTSTQREVIHAFWPAKGRSWVFPVSVHLVRVSKTGRMLDDDNLRSAFKAIRDQVAAELGIDDGDKARVRFTYDEVRGPWGIRIEVVEVPPP
jgi:hypothetical protein